MSIKKKLNLEKKIIILNLCIFLIKYKHILNLQKHAQNAQYFNDAKLYEF